jgi:hypothetical protein
MRRPSPFSLLITALAVVLLAGCGGGDGASPSADPRAVVDSWSQALNGGDDDGAAKLFAAGAVVIQDGSRRTLADEEDARAFNASLPCGAKVTGTDVSGREVTVTYTLTRRPGHMCDGTGEAARTLVRVEAGRITLWHQLASATGGVASA